MQEFKDKVAVITGGASGIGRGFAERCAQEGMKVVLADVEENALRQAEEELKAGGAQVLAVKTDVSRLEEVERLARETMETFGAVHLLFNNAGVGAGGAVWESTLADWEWVIGVNLWGVIYGIKVFVPLMLAQGSEGHIVNTASMAGLVAGPGMGVYKVTKHAVVSLSETLHAELAERHSALKVSVLCPGWVQTQIMESARNRPAELTNEPGVYQVSPEELAIREAVKVGLTTEQVADIIFQAMRDERLYILTHPEWKPLIQRRFNAILRDNDAAK